MTEKLKEGDEQSFRHLYDHYSKALFNIILQVVKNHEQAEDVLQQSFIKIWKNIDRYEPAKGRLFTWMLNIARNQAIDATRSKEFNNNAKTVSLTENVYNKEGVPAAIQDFGINKMLEMLNPESRKLLELSYFMGYTQEEIAAMLQIPLGTVKSRIRSIILQLRKKMTVI